MRPPAAEPTRLRFLESALSEVNPLHSTEQTLGWLLSTGPRRQISVRPIPLRELGEWFFEESTGDLAHRSGKFFRVHGLRVSTDLRRLGEWDQPIIDQPEIGILGIIAREIDGLLYFLMQAKMEPGNPFGVQLVPTVQATRSNYTQVHLGSRPQFVEYFLERGRARVLVDQLQFEQGSAFLRKRNRNIVVEVGEDVPADQSYRWLTLGQIKKLLAYPNLVSMDTRTVISCISLVSANRPNGAKGRRGPRVDPRTGSFGSIVLASFGALEAANEDEAVLSWLTNLKCQHQLTVQRTGLRGIRGWHVGDDDIAHEGGRFFRVMGVDVEADSREVARWSQPLIAPVEQGLIALLAQQIDGVLHVLVQGRAEPGSPDIVIVGPTVQCALGYERSGDPDSWPPFYELVAKAELETIRYSCAQTEEGGRFYRLENEYRVVELEPGASLDLPENYLWVTLRQLQELLRYGLVNVEARSLLACLSFT